MRQPGKWPLPSIEGCGPDPQCQQAKRHEIQLHLPLPFSKGCGQLVIAQRRIQAGRYTRGDPRSGRPSQCIPKTSHDESHSSFSPSILPFSLYHISNPIASVGTRSWRGEPCKGETMPMVMLDNDNVGTLWHMGVPTMIRVRWRRYRFDGGVTGSTTMIRVLWQPYGFNDGHTGLTTTMRVRRWR